MLALEQLTGLALREWRIEYLRHGDPEAWETSCEDEARRILERLSTDDWITGAELFFRYVSPWELVEP